MSRISHRVRNGLLLLACIGTNVPVDAQWRSDAPIVMDGTTEADRQVTGAWDPLSLNAAVPANALRATSTTFTTLTGWDPLIGSLTPEPTTLEIGLLLTAIPSSTNPASPSLDLNGSGARPIVHDDGTPIDSAEFVPGLPVRMLFDGTRYVMLNAVPLPCSPGYSAPNRGYCIADSSREANTFFAAALDCAANGARLCTLSEWANACFHFPDFFATVPSGEWVDHAANHESTAKIAGFGDNGTMVGQGCDFGTLSVPTGLFRYRCCTSR